MGDVFDRIVDRAAAAPGAERPSGLTVRRGPRFDEPGRAVPEPEPGPGQGGAGVWHGTPEDRAPDPVAPVDPPPSTTRGRDRGPGTGAPTAQPQHVAAPSFADHPAPDPESTVPSLAPPSRARDGDHSADGTAARAVPAKAPPQPSRGAQPPGAEPAPAPAVLRVRRRAALPGAAALSSPTRTVSPEQLLREQVAPALGDHGALEVRDAGRLEAVGLDPVEVPAGGDVHVHLGHVEVVQHAPARPVPDPPRQDGRAAATDRVDHADYLARQQRRWS